MNVDLQQILSNYKAALDSELQQILTYWQNNTLDKIHGGFVGAIDDENNEIPNAPKSAILNCRILWTFSTAYNVTKQPNLLAIATTAFNFIQLHFIDKKNGGIFWMLHANASVLDAKKQVYALAFAIYGYSAYFIASNNVHAKQAAIQLFELIEQHCFDVHNTGYFEAFSATWQPIDDVRLSTKDANEKKTMNTHLHVLEAYTLLYKIWPNAFLKTKIVLLISNFTNYFIDKNTNQSILFFNEKWVPKSTITSYGHDIETAWLLVKAAEELQLPALLKSLQNIAEKLAHASLQGIDKDGGMWYEIDNHSQTLIKEKHWWVQAEAMVGFFNTWQHSKNTLYLHQSLLSWHFVQQKIKDTQFGEWRWGVDANGSPMKNKDKVGSWKCPYHNARACIEISVSIQNMIQSFQHINA